MKSAFLVYFKDLKEKIISKNLGGLNLCKKVEGEYDMKDFLESLEIGEALGNAITFWTVSGVGTVPDL